MRQAAAILLALVTGAAAPQRHHRRRVGKPPAATATTAHIPPFARWPYEPFSREAAVQIALGEWRAFRQPVVFPNIELPEDEEREEGLWQRVGLYWWLGLDPSWPQSGWTGIHDENGQVFPAGRDGFYRLVGGLHLLCDADGRRRRQLPLFGDPCRLHRRRGPARSRRCARSRAGRGLRAAARRFDLPVARRQPGDLRPAADGRFPGHCDIVVDIKPGQLDVIGGNVDNAVAMKYIPVTADGHLAGPDGVVLDPDHHWFVVLKVLYQRDGTCAAEHAISGIALDRGRPCDQRLRQPPPRDRGRRSIIASASPGSRSSASR